jgi:protein required for attachment to host cells
LSPIDREVESWLRQVTTMLPDFDLGERGTSLKVVAEPRLLGRLRPHLEKLLPQEGLSFEEKDYAWLSVEEIHDRLLAS